MKDAPHAGRPRLEGYLLVGGGGRGEGSGEGGKASTVGLLIRVTIGRLFLHLGCE